MGNALGILRSRVYECFDTIGSLTSIREQIHDGMRPDMADIVDRAARDFDLPALDKDSASKINKFFKYAANGWDDAIREQVAQFACWTRQAALRQGEEDAPSIRLPYIIKRIEAFLDDRPSQTLKTDRLIQKMDRAGLAIWEWFSRLEDANIKYMGELVCLTEEEAFGKYFPREYSDVEVIVRETVATRLQREGICFDYWKTEGRGTRPPVPMP